MDVIHRRGEIGLGFLDRAYVVRIVLADWELARSGEQPYKIDPL
jgi:hypothetical protein